MDRAEIVRKYNRKVAQSFETKMDVFLFQEIIDHGNPDDIEDNDESYKKFIGFQLTDDILLPYENSLPKEGDQAVVERPGLTYGCLDNMIRTWQKENAALRAVWLEKYKKEFKFNPDETTKSSVDAFVDFYGLDDAQRTCSYCGISDAEIAEMRKEGISVIRTKRGRGRSMEIDRHNSRREYYRSNVCLACYWCNNAKTDEFSADEFKAIGAEIAKIWKARLSR